MGRGGKGGGHGEEAQPAAWGGGGETSGNTERNVAISGLPKRNYCMQWLGQQLLHATTTSKNRIGVAMISPKSIACNNKHQKRVACNSSPSYYCIERLDHAIVAGQAVARATIARAQGNTRNLSCNDCNNSKRSNYGIAAHAQGPSVGSISGPNYCMAAKCCTKKQGPKVDR